MYNDNYNEDIITQEEFLYAYQTIRADLTNGMTENLDRCTIILGGQPGAGKSIFYQTHNDTGNHIAINGDEFRRYHPNYDTIIRNDPEHYAERTQPFSNLVVEALIEDLGNHGYNLIIEGTLRNPDVPINTCESLQSKGYRTDLVVIACDAEKSWNSTVSRASWMKENGRFPRLVPIDIYNRTVHQIPYSLETIKSRGCFDSITIMNRDGEILYKDTDEADPADVLREELNLENWDDKFPIYEREFIEEKIEILKMSLEQDMKQEIDIEPDDIESEEEDIESPMDDDYDWSDFD